MMKYRLGLDVGTNSLGWAVIELDGSGKIPQAVKATGARIFQDGREVKSKSTLKATRTLARSSRRRLDRYKQRKRYLMSELTKNGMFPLEKHKQRDLQDIDPLLLRAKALDQELSLYEIGRVLFHLNQRRGFKSNRKDAESRSGVVRDSIEKMRADLKESGNRTFGEFLWNRRKQGLETRARRSGTKSADLYQFYPSRELLEEEFSIVWDNQAQYHSILNEQNKEHFYKIIYHQRPLKPQARGMCSYISSEKRCYRALPSFQRYRILQEVNNLEWTTLKGTFRLIEIPQARDLVLETMLRPSTKNGRIVFSKLAKIVKELDLAEGNVRFNLQSDKRKHLDGDLTAAVMQQAELVGDDWHSWSLDKQDSLIELLLDPEKDDEVVLGVLISHFNIPNDKATNVLNSPIPDGTSNLSKVAACKLADLMEHEYCIQSDAVIKSAESENNFDNPYQLAASGQILDQLPYYGEYVQGHTIPSQAAEADHQSKAGMVSNPTVHIALNQIRAVVNELITRFGHPYSIAIELGRDLPASEMGRKKTEREQKVNQDRNDRLRDKLRELGRSVSHDNIVRLNLWEELGSNPTDRRCIFTGKVIGIADLFNGNCEIEHLLPFSQSLDDSLSNKTMCYLEANRFKGNQAPFEAFGDSPAGYQWQGIYERVKLLPSHKHWRFEQNAMKKWQSDHGDFLARHLNDTRYIGRLAREYLTAICKPSKVDVVTGKLTSLMRHHWGLNRVLNLTEDAKNRDDHRHHAVDAIVVGMTNKASLQKLHKAARRAESIDLHRIIDDGDEIEPWQGFRDEVEELIKQTVVSHKPTRHTQGKLHNDTAMSICDGPDSKGRYQVMQRKPVEKFTSLKSLDEIKDQRIAAQLKELASKTSIPEAFSLLKIKKIRSVKTKQVIPIRNSDGEIYKAYKGDSNWAMEIYEMPEGTAQAGKWVERIVSTYEANQDNKLANTRKPHPAARLVMRLHRNDYLWFEGEGEKLLRVQKLSAGIITMAKPNEANTDSRNRDKENEFTYMYKSAGALKKIKAKKAHISPTGLVSF